MHHYMGRPAMTMYALEMNELNYPLIVLGNNQIENWISW